MSKRIEGQAGLEGVDLAGAQKVAALLLALGKPLADRIIRNFDDSEIRVLAKTASNLPAVTPGRLEGLLEELEKCLGDPGHLVGSSVEAQQLLAGVVSDDQVSQIMAEIEGTAHDRVWTKLASVADDKIAEVVCREQPQVAAFILSRLDVGKASAVLEKIDVAIGSDISRRLLTLKPIHEEAQRLVAERLESELFNDAAGATSINRHAQLGAILNQLKRDQVTEILSAIEQQLPDDARRVKEHVFNFEDIVAMPSVHRVRLMEEVPTERLVLALRNCEAGLRDCILAALSPRARRLVETELSSGAQLVQRNIEEARRQIATLALSMAERQMIVLRPPVETDASSS